MFSGLMLSQYTADMQIVEQRILCMPASIQSIPAAADQEDFVSMGMTTAIKTRQIIDNAQCIVGIEMIAAAQALDFRGPHDASPATRAAYDVIREHVEVMTEDRPTFNDLNAMAKLVRSERIIEAVKIAVGEFR